MGDIIIFEAILDILKRLKPVARIYCFSTDMAYTNTHYGVHSSNPFTLKGVWRTIRNLRRSDLVLLGGGELVQTQSSFLYLVANLAPGFLSWLFHKKCLAIGVGIADQKEISKIGKIITAFVLNRIEKICVRDQWSLINARALGIKKEKLVLAADLALHFAELKPVEPQNSLQTVLLSPRYTRKRKGAFLPSWVKRKMSRTGHDDDFHASVSRFSDLLKRLCQRYQVIILPVFQGRGTSSDDYLFAQNIVAAAGSPENARIYRGAMTARAIMALMQKIDGAVSVPLHALVMAAVMQKPVVALPYASKCRHLMKELGLEDCVVKTTEQGAVSDSLSVFQAIEKCMQPDSHRAIKLKQSLEKLSRRHGKNISAIEKATKNVF
jgi:polysaccharide pyruvyl transferase WcaK-like protein